MPSKEQRRQQSLQRKAAKRKQRRQVLARAEPASPRLMLRSAGSWPLEECLITEAWAHEGALVQILVVRRAPDGMLGAALMLVDLGCLGVKDAFVTFFPTWADYNERLRQPFREREPMMRAELDLAAKIVRDAVAYAAQFGFKPHRDYAEAAAFLEGANPDACDVQVPLGIEGKPFFVAGPYDNVPRIIDQLTRAVGAGNFHYLVEAVPPPELDGDWDEAQTAP